VSHIVQVRYSGGDWADLMADMHSWLDRRQIEAEELSHSLLGRSIAVRVVFSDEDHAAAFATAFSGRLQPGTQATTPSPCNNAHPNVSKGSTYSDELVSASVQPTLSAPPAGVSLMITRQQKADLRERGYSDQQIRDMKPEEAHRVLGLIG
jgi:hypothetical protein